MSTFFYVAINRFECTQTLLSSNLIVCVCVCGRVHSSFIFFNVNTFEAAIRKQSVEAGSRKRGSIKKRESGKREEGGGEDKKCPTRNLVHFDNNNNNNFNGRPRKIWPSFLCDAPDLFSHWITVLVTWHCTPFLRRGLYRMRWCGAGFIGHRALARCAPCPIRRNWST